MRSGIRHKAWQRSHVFQKTAWSTGSDGQRGLRGSGLRSGTRMEAEILIQFIDSSFQIPHKWHVQDPAPRQSGMKKLLCSAQQVAPPNEGNPGPPRKNSPFTLYPYQFTVQYRKLLRHAGCVECGVKFPRCKVELLRVMGPQQFVVSLSSLPAKRIWKSALIPAARR